MLFLMIENPGYLVKIKHTNNSKLLIVQGANYEQISCSMWVRWREMWRWVTHRYLWQLLKSHKNNNQIS